MSQPLFITPARDEGESDADYLVRLNHARRRYSSGLAAAEWRVCKAILLTAVMVFVAFVIAVCVVQP